MRRYAHLDDLALFKGIANHSLTRLRQHELALQLKPLNGLLPDRPEFKQDGILIVMEGSLAVLPSRSGKAFVLELLPGEVWNFGPTASSGDVVPDLKWGYRANSHSVTRVQIIPKQVIATLEPNDQILIFSRLLDHQVQLFQKVGKTALVRGKGTKRLISYLEELYQRGEHDKAGWIARLFDEQFLEVYTGSRASAYRALTDLRKSGQWEVNELNPADIQAGGAGRVYYQFRPNALRSPDDLH